MKTKSKSKTFAKGDEVLSQMLDFIVENIETYDDTPAAGAGDTQPPDPVDRLKYKYVITVTRFEKSQDSE